MKITIELDERIYSAEDPEGERYNELIELFVAVSKAAGYTDLTIEEHICKSETL